MEAACMSDPRLSIVVPCFNEEAVIAELYDRSTKAARLVAGESFEIVFVDDGSFDSTLARLTTLAEHDFHVVVVRLSRNFGHQLAPSAGLQYCRGERVLILDADLQDPPELLAEMADVMDRQCADVVYGQRHGARRPGIQDGRPGRHESVAGSSSRRRRMTTVLILALAAVSYRSIPEYKGTGLE
jgi:glycosyltransferase involved in cell wall biosynthesis